MFADQYHVTILQFRFKAHWGYEFFKVDLWPSSVFDCITGASQVNLLWPRAPLLGLPMYYVKKKKQLSWHLFSSRQQESLSFYFFFSFKLKFKRRSQVKDDICLKHDFRSFLHTTWSCLEANKFLSKTNTRFPRPRVRRRFLCINSLSDVFSLCNEINPVLTM